MRKNRKEKDQKEKDEKEKDEKEKGGDFAVVSYVLHILFVNIPAIGSRG